MSSYYSDDEQVEKLKLWWQNYGPAVIVGVVLGLALLGGNKYWHHYKKTQADAASVIYEKTLDQLKRKDWQAGKQTAQQLLDAYAATPYAELAALNLAGIHYRAGEKDMAKERLEWAIKNARSEASQQTARLRLSRILFDDGELEPALDKLGDKPAVGFESEYYELKADLLLGKGQIDEARDLYRNALQNVDGGSAYTEILQMKLDNLGAGKDK